MQIFRSSFLIALLGVIGAFFIGGWSGVYIASILAILEISLSFDNAVVNAKILETMDPLWQKRFIVWGIPIAVFGMRFLFPIIIVAISSGMGVLETLQTALYHPEHYKEALEAKIDLIYAFGGAFLLMVFLDFLFEESRKEYWIGLIEHNIIIRTFKQMHNIELIIATAIGIVLTEATKSYLVATAFFSGLLLHALINAVDEFLGSEGVRSGVMGFIYLEVLDASFSFDGVIGAFALSSNIFIIMIGLGIGAMFVRSLTLYLVEKKTLQTFPYLEHGAHYAIGALALIMFLKIFIDVSEVVTGTLGIAFIAAAVLHSWLKERFLDAGR